MIQEPIKTLGERSGDALRKVLPMIKDIPLEPLDPDKLMLERISARLTERLPRVYYDEYLPRLYVESFDRVKVQEENRKGNKIFKEYPKIGIINGEKVSLEEFRVREGVRLGLFSIKKRLRGKPSI